MHILSIILSIKHIKLKQVVLDYCIFASTFPWVYILLILNLKSFLLICVNNFINQTCIFALSYDLIFHLYLELRFYTHNGCQIVGLFLVHLQRYWAVLHSLRVRKKSKIIEKRVKRESKKDSVPWIILSQINVGSTVRTS